MALYGGRILKKSTYRSYKPRFVSGMTGGYPLENMKRQNFSGCRLVQFHMLSTDETIRPLKKTQLGCFMFRV